MKANSAIRCLLYKYRWFMLFLPYHVDSSCNLLGRFLNVSEVGYDYCRGIMIRTLADASNDQQSLSAPQIMCTVFGFLLTVATTVVVTVYAKKRLSELQTDEEQLLLQ